MSVTWDPSPTTVDRAVIREAEKRLGVKLPASFVSFTLKHPGARASSPRVLFPIGAGGPRVLRRFLPFTAPAPEGTVQDCHGWIKDRVPTGVVPFATDIAQNFLCFDFRHDGRVVIHDHELTGESSLTLVAPTFEDFLSSLRPESSAASRPVPPNPWMKKRTTTKTKLPRARGKKIAKKKSVKRSKR